MTTKTVQSSLNRINRAQTERRNQIADPGNLRQCLQPPRNQFKGVVPSQFLGRYLL